MSLEPAAQDSAVPKESAALMTLRPLSERALTAESTEVMAYHGRTFRLASLLLPVSMRNDASITYAFCRLIDDMVDEAESLEEGKVEIQALRKAYQQETYHSNLQEGFSALTHRLNIPRRAVLDLMAGVEGDAESALLQSDAELIQYSYKVAGTVGLMMARVLGVKDDSLLPFAIDMGIGMQLTNICRDVLEDAKRGRVYLPADRLKAAGTSHEELLSGQANPEAVASVVRDVLTMAEDYYKSGLRGLCGVPWRARTGIIAAMVMYREIGRKLLRRGGNPLKGRTIVGPVRKGILICQAVLLSPCLPFWRRRQHHARLHSSLNGVEGANPPNVVKID